MTVKGGSRPACAACRFQRRRCSSDCPLAPYFPANEPQVFQNVHSLYGVGHVMKILNQLKDDEQKEEAMTSIKYESNIRQIYKAHGCYGVLSQLQQKLMESIDELKRVLVLLNAYKTNANKGVQNSFSSDQVVGGSSDWINEMITGGADLGFNYNVTSSYDQVVGYDRDDQRKTTIDLTPNQLRFDEFQQFCSGEQDQESQDYTDIMCGNSFVDDQESFRVSKEVQDLKLESPDTAYVTEPVDDKLIQGVHGLTTGF
ncbi:hypothetical protein R6Q59_008921 [Mikania micrantha]|uniref:LOB domain-containing protein n=1 Tax=Mikania micrantha TaxID=192012 RepID=A0A5N6Q8B5_9ASTR|nr:hypothetical protein E3N88_03237 [Mikania micrantha]